MEKSISNFYENNFGQNIAEYENSHRDRFDFLITDLGLNNLYNASILDIGCGYGPIFNRLNSNIQKFYHGIDGANLINNTFSYEVADLSYDHFSDRYTQKFDYILSFETFEHLTNPYHCLLEIKKLMHENSIFYLSVPHESVTHNTIYPGLLYPIDNFKTFLKQCAMSIIDHRIHSKSFVQNVFVLKSLDWSYSEMLWYKSNDKFRNIPPHISINL